MRSHPAVILLMSQPFSPVDRQGCHVDPGHSGLAERDRSERRIRGNQFQIMLILMSFRFVDFESDSPFMSFRLSVQLLFHKQDESQIKVASQKTLNPAFRGCDTLSMTERVVFDFYHAAPVELTLGVFMTSRRLHDYFRHPGSTIGVITVG